MKAPKLFNINFTLLLQGLLVSQLGSTIYFVAIALWVKENTQSATTLGLIGVATFLPSILIGPLAGTYVDKWSRKKIIILCDVISGLLPVGVAYLMFFHSHEKTLIVTSLFIAGILSSITSSFFRPAVMASVPNLVPKSKIIKANGLINTAFSVSVVAGQSLAGVLFTLFSIPALVFINGITYLLSAFTESFIRLEKQTDNTDQTPQQSIKENIQEGMTYYKQIKGLFLITVIFSSYLFFTSTVVIGLPYYVELQLKETEAWFGYLLASTGVGLLIGSLLVTTPFFHLMNRSKVVIVAIVLSGIAFITFALTTSPIIAACMLIVRGAVFGVLSAWLPSIAQIYSPDHLRGRILSLFNSMTMAAMPLGYVLSGLVIDVLDHDTQWVFMFCGVCTIAIVFPLLSNTSFNRLMSYKT